MLLRSLGIAGALARAGIAGVVARAEIAGALARAGIDTSLSFSLSLAPSLARFSARLEGVIAAACGRQLAEHDVQSLRCEPWHARAPR